MNCASARCRRASDPLSNEKRAPEIFAAVSKSNPCRPSPSSTWSFTEKSKTGLLPTLRTSTLSASDFPRGTLSCGVLGKISSMACNEVCNSESCTSMLFNSSPTCATSAMMSDVSSPRALACPISFDELLRFACNSCVRICIVLRAASSS